MLAGDVPRAVDSPAEPSRAAAPLTATLAAGAPRDAGNALTVGQETPMSAAAISAAAAASAAADRAPYRSQRRDIRQPLQRSPGTHG